LGISDPEYFWFFPARISHFRRGGGSRGGSQASTTHPRKAGAPGAGAGCPQPL